MNRTAVIGVIVFAFVFLGLALQRLMPEAYSWSGPIIAGVIVGGTCLGLRAMGIPRR